MNAAETRVVSFTPPLSPHPPIYCYRVVEDKRRKNTHTPTHKGAFMQSDKGHVSREPHSTYA